MIIEKVKTNIDYEIKSPLLKRLVWVLIFAVLMFFVIYPIATFRNTGSVMKTQTAVRKTVYDTLDVDAFAVRSEAPINNTFTGTIVPAVSNGNKVAVGDAVANIYSNEKIAENAARLTELEEEIAYYRSIAATVGGTLQSDIDLYKNNVSNSLFALSECIENGELSDIYVKSRELREAITKKQIATGVSFDVSSIIAQLTAEYDAIKGSATPSSSIRAQNSGYYVSTSDGYENTLNFADVKKLTFTEVENALNSIPEVVSVNNVGKVITDFNWYLVCNADIGRLGNITAGSTVTVTFTNSPVEDLRMTVVAINQSAGKAPVTLVLKSNIMDEDIADLRLASIKIRVDSYSGLAIDRQALRTVDGEKGVYVKVGNIAEFKKVNIIYSAEDFVLSEAPENERGYLELYDEIILEGTELYDSKLLN